MKVKKQILASQIALKRSQNNEKELESALSKYFKIIEEAIQRNLEEYWNDNMLQGQVDLILQPLTDAEDVYYSILEKYIQREYKLGINEAKRLVELANTKQSFKAVNRRKLIKGIRTIASRLNLFGTLDDAEAELLARTKIFSKRTLARITTDINTLLTQGYTEGKGINFVAATITKRFNQLETWEAKRIARTEIHNAHNNAVMKTYETLGVEYTQWISAGDDGRTRESHLGPDDGYPDGVDGEIIRIGDTYSNGLEYPGDTNGPIEEWINCRCSNAPFVMPYGMMAPPGMVQFREDDLIPIK